MKQIALAFLLALSSSCGFGQDFFDSIFAKYSGQSNVVSISIGKDLLKLAASMDSSSEAQESVNKLHELKILVRSNENKASITGKTFTGDVLSFVEKSDYLKLMEVVDSDTKLNFYAKKSGKTITHLVMVGGEPGEEILLSLKGDFTTKDLVTIGKNGGSDGLSHLAKLKTLEEKH